MKQTAESIFIVDDDADDRQIIKDAFIHTGVSSALELFDSGNALLEHLSKLDPPAFPSLILLDLNMPGKDGLEILSEIKGKDAFRHIPIVIFTTSSFEKDRINCYERGANCFVTKPSAYDKLLASIRSIGKLWLSESLVKTGS